MYRHAKRGIMGTTRAYKNTRLLTHLLTLLIIIANILLLISFALEHKFFQVENTLNLGIFDLQASFKYTIILHIVLALFGACTINSKVKLYVKLYLLVGFLFLCILMAFFIFTVGPYRTLFDNQFSYQVGQNTSIRYFVRSMFNCSEYGIRDCLSVMKAKVNYMIRIYSIISGFSFVLALVVYILGKIVLFIDVCVPDKRDIVPTMERNVHMGYDSVSLRTRRIVDPNLRFTGSVLDTEK